MKFQKFLLLSITSVAVLVGAVLGIKSWNTDKPAPTETAIVPTPMAESPLNVGPPATTVATVPVEQEKHETKTNPTLKTTLKTKLKTALKTKLKTTLKTTLQRKNVAVNRVAKGSFTVWADPAIPAEGQNYTIHVLVKLPANSSHYSADDLSGTLDGSDGYDLTINSPENAADQTLLFEPGSDTAELILDVPGGATGTADTLAVTSRLLNESQRISVQFN
jgi:hypothetical protein